MYIRIWCIIRYTLNKISVINSYSNFFFTYHDVCKINTRLCINKEVHILVN